MLKSEEGMVAGTRRLVGGAEDTSSTDITKPRRLNSCCFGMMKSTSAFTT